MKKFKMLPLIMSGIFTVLFVVLSLVIGGVSGHTASFWISFSLMLVAVCEATFCLMKTMKDGAILKDIMFSFPLWEHTLIFFLYELVVSVLFMILDGKVHFAFPLILGLLGIIVYSFFAFSCLLARGIVGEIQKEVKIKTTNLRMMQADAESLAENCTTPEAKKAASKLAEDIRFSDPMTDDSLNSIDDEIKRYIRDARIAVAEGREEDVPALCREMGLLLSERNRKCRILK